MNSTDLTPEQLNQVFAQLAPTAQYLARVTGSHGRAELTAG